MIILPKKKGWCGAQGRVNACHPYILIIFLYDTFILRKSLYRYFYRQ